MAWFDRVLQPSLAVPATDAWFHEVKYDGYRLIVVREADRVRLITRNGHDWSGRFPWITEAALKNRNRHFAIDGEAVSLKVDGVADFNALTPGSMMGAGNRVSRHR
jgi:bifunctional non-homologous end joining protein LigD